MMDKLTDWILIALLLALGLPTFIMLTIGIWASFIEVMVRVI